MSIRFLKSKNGTNKDMVLICHHLGLGDMVECNGMVRHYSEKYKKVDIFSKECHYETTKKMYSDNSNIIIHKIGNGSTPQVIDDIKKVYDQYVGDIVVPGYSYYYPRDGVGPAEIFYELANVPWQFRNEKFFINRDIKKEQEILETLNPKKEKYIFIHDDDSRGYKIDIETDLKVIKNDIRHNIIDMISIFEGAEEIHCMSSSVLCLIDCLTTQVNFKKLFLHWGVRKVKLGKNSLAGKWNII